LLSLTIQEKINLARRRIRVALNRYSNIAILWSAGKDSQVVLALAREFGDRFTVIHLRPLDGGTRDAFADRVIAEWGLQTHTLPVVERALTADANRHTNILYVHRYNDVALSLPVEAHSTYEPNADSYSLNDLFQAPTDEDSPIPQFDILLNGTRKVDQDALVTIEPKGVYDKQRKMLYPLYEWTDDDIWEASELLGIPQNEARYKQQDLLANADYHPICTRCVNVKADAPTHVLCPKENKLIKNFGIELKEEMATVRERLSQNAWS